MTTTSSTVSRVADTAAELHRYLTDELGGRRTSNGAYKIWSVPHPAGGYVTVEVRIRPRWCSIAVDRWRTTDRPKTAEAWFKTNVWPTIHGYRRAGTLPMGGPTYTSAYPIERNDLLHVLQQWIPPEINDDWGTA